MEKSFILQQQEISFVKNTFTDKLIEHLGIIEGTKVRINERKLGYDVCCFIGIILKSAKDYDKVIKQLESIDEVVEAYYTTGNYSIFIKVMTHTIAELHSVLATKIQLIDEIQSTETLISMQNPILRDIKP